MIATQMIPASPIYLDTAVDPVFGLFHAPAGDALAGTPVLICAPWGWDEVASYRSRKGWAERLAAAGHPTLRFDLPATGNSGGLPADPARLESWVGALASAAEWLRDAGEPPRVAAVGIGLGGLLAREAISRGAPIEELVLWGSPATGKAFVREVRAFSRLQGWSSDAGDCGDPSRLPEGWMEAGGFVLSAETIEALRALNPDDAPSSLRRALLLDRDGVAVDSGVRARMAGAGVEVAGESGSGWGQMMSHPERSRLALDVASAVETWLAGGDRPDRATSFAEDGGSPAPAGALGELRVGLGEREVCESSWTVEQPFGRAFGILAEPVDAPAPDVCAVFFNAGAVRNTGPNRMWVETYRRWAARGMQTLRVDLEGIGEADGDESRFTDVAEFYIPEFDDQVGAVLDALERQGVGSRFLLVGLCAGGYWSFRTALRDPRVQTAVLLNAGALKWHPDLLGDREARKLARVLRRRWWKKLLLGEISLQQLRILGRSILRKAGQLTWRAVRLLTGRENTPAGDRGFDAEFDRLVELDTRLTMAFSAEELLHAELRSAGIPARLESWPNIELESLPGDDHTLRSIPAQVAARELLDRELERALEREGRRRRGDLDGGASHPRTRQR
jgi:alpha-beta hydrolase superfamily lysophospholipase